MQQKKHRDHLRLVVNILTVVLMTGLVTAYLTDNLGINPVQKAQQLSGDTAIILLLLCLSITPLRTLTGNNRIKPLRRAFGLNAFYFASLHMLILFGLNYRFNPAIIAEAFGLHRYVWLGLAAYLILLVLAITSNRIMKIKLGQAWKKIHRSVYLAGILVVLHYGWTRIGNSLAGSGSLAWPVVAGIILGLGLVLRLKPVKQWIFKLRSKAS